MVNVPLTSGDSVGIPMEDVGIHLNSWWYLLELKV